MSSTVPVVSPVGLQRFTLFTSLPLEIRFVIWQLSLPHRVIEILATENRITGFYSQAAHPVILHVCRESRQAVEVLYPCCFGSPLQPEIVRFNFDLDTLYFDISQEEEGLHRFFGVLKETELARLKYVAIDEAYLAVGVVDLHSSSAGLKRALKAMTGLKEITVVRDVTIMRPDYYSSPRKQIKFYAERKLGEAEEGWPGEVEELPDVKEISFWKPSNAVMMKAVYGWRGM